MIIDTHAHLDQPEFTADLDNVIRRAEQNGVEAIVSVGLDLESNRSTIALADRYNSIWAAIGIHPHNAASLNDAALGEMREMARHPKVVAIGETGLDFYRNRAPKDAQIRAFERQLELASELDLPVVVHDREAHDEVMRIIKARVKPQPVVGLAGPIGQRRFVGVMHCFSGDVTLAREAIELGFAISIAGPVTYPKSDRLAEVVREVPAETLIAETDCPFLAPQQRRGRRNEPAYVWFTVERMAALRGESFEAVAELTTDNARRLFALR